MSKYKYKDLKNEYFIKLECNAKLKENQTLHLGKSGTIQESNQAFGVRKAHYAYNYIKKLHFVS